LIMTELTFLEDGNGRFRVRQWWYLKPPHLKPSGIEIPYPQPIQLEGVTNPVAQCAVPNDLRTCDTYEDSLRCYHAKLGPVDPWNPMQGIDSVPMDQTISGSHGLTHYDFQPLRKSDGLPFNPDVEPQYLITDHEYNYHGGSEGTVIYVRGGPLQLKGRYKGRYTVVTDEYQLYRRHAWPQNANAPVDTLWCSIWLMDDIVNSDVPHGSIMAPDQPFEGCDCEDEFSNCGGSENVLGILSGANVVIAATRANGVRNCQAGGCNIIIHAAIMALNESFVMHYWQNTVNTAGGMYQAPPWGDGRGINKWGTSGTADDRGVVYVHGGVTQWYRGWMRRNNPGPYPTGNIGMTKTYNFDSNLLCHPPPHFPKVERSGTDEREISLLNYGVY